MCGDKNGVAFSRFIGQFGAAEPGASTTDRLVIELIQILDKPNIFTLQLKVLLLTHSIFEKSNH